VGSCRLRIRRKKFAPRPVCPDSQVTECNSIRAPLSRAPVAEGPEVPIPDILRETPVSFRNPPQPVPGSIAAVVLGLVLLAGCGSSVPTALDRLERCGPEEGPTDAYCGVYEVFEDREASSGRTIPLKIVVLPAFSNNPASDPVFFLAGGPGEAAAEVAEALGGIWSRVRRSRDIVLVNQRGTGKENPLDCDTSNDEDSQIDVFDSTRFVDKMRVCLEAYDADPTQYLTSIAMDDLDEIRSWLGYGQINVYGGSYGTRAALVYLRRHPDTVRTVVLDGVAPPDMALSLYTARDGQRALDKLFADCAADAGCHERFGDLDTKLRNLIERLDRDKPVIETRHPRTGEPFTVRLTPAAIQLPLFGALYAPGDGMIIPLLIDEASNGNFAPFLAVAMQDSPGSEVFSQGMFYSVVCAEDSPRVDVADTDAAVEGTFLGRTFFETRMKPCEFWPRADVEPKYYEPVESDAPTLILSGDLDPITPPSWGESVAGSLPNSRHLIAPSVGHGVMPVGCGMRLIEEFIESADAQSLDASCLGDIKRPPFFVRPSGPEVSND